jgi:hypothetical protein
LIIVVVVVVVVCRKRAANRLPDSLLTSLLEDGQGAKAGNT